MSNKYCAGCAAEMAEDAPTCPKCGKPSQATDKKLGIGMIIGIILVPFIFAWFTLKKGHSTKSRIMSFGWLVLGLSLVGMQESGTSTQGASNGSSSSASGPSVIATLRAPQLIAEYEQNEVAADNKYKKKYVRVTGSISDIGKDLLDDIFITLDGGGADEAGLREVQAFFSDSGSRVIASLTRGSGITLVCRVDGLMMNVVLRDCSIE